MKSKRFLIPGFLNKADDSLLLNNPVIWTTRTHLVVYYTFLFAFVLTLLCFIVPEDPRNESNVFVWTTLTAILSSLGIILWIIYLLRFNVFKRFGNNGSMDALKNFILFFLALGSMIAPAFIPAAVESMRANKAYANEEVVNDINSINTKINQLEYDSLNHKWKKESYIVRDSVAGAYIDAAAAVSDNMIDSITGSYFVDTANFRQKLLMADSVVKLNDSMYNFYTCPEYVFLRIYNADRYTITKVKNDLNLYKEIIQYFKPIDKQNVAAELKQLLQKYLPPAARQYANYAKPYNEYSSYRDVLDERYQLYDAEQAISNIIDKKYRWYSNNASRFRVWYYITFVLVLLAFIFRYSTVKAFFLSILTCIILLVLSALLVAFFRIDEAGGIGLALFYYFIFFTLFMVTAKSNIRTTAGGIALNIVTFFTAIIPLQCMLCYYSYTEKDFTLVHTAEYYETKENYLLIAEIAGIVLFLVLLQPFFKPLYRNWFAKPEE
jgi:hypothetical protein